MMYMYMKATQHNLPEEVVQEKLALSGWIWTYNTHILGDTLTN